MTITVVRYNPSFNVASIPLRQTYNNNYTKTKGGMPLKTGFADNTSTFSEGRRKFMKAPICSIYLYNNLNCRTGAVRVEGLDFPPYGSCNDVVEVNPYIQNGVAKLPYEGEGIPYVLRAGNVWSTSNHTIHNRRRNHIGCGGSAPNTCLINGKQNNIMSSQERISRIKGIAIGKGSTISPSDKSSLLSFNENNLDRSHTTYLAVSNARRRARSGGYVVPPKCRGHGSGPAPPFGALGNRGTGFDYSKQNNFTKNSCGQRGWPVTPLLGK